jgi:hypothetical protein
MANKAILRVQVSLRRVVDLSDERPEHDDKSRSSDKNSSRVAKSAKARAAE